MEATRAWRWRAWAALGVAMAAWGCGKTAAPEGPAPQQVAGAGGAGGEPRLVPWQLEALGAPPLTVGIYDRERAEHCRFVADRDGVTRCLPLPATDLELQVNYADASCTQPIYYAPYAKDARSLLGRSVAVPLPAQGCETRYAVGTLAEIAPTQRFYRSPNDCTPIGPPAQQEGSHDFVLAQEADPEAWVAAKEVAAASLGGRVRLRRFETDGDVQLDARLVDERWDEPCRVVDAGTALVCAVATLPERSAYFTDSKCQDGPLWPVATCPEPAYIGDFSLSGDKYALGALWDGPIFSQGKVCEPADTSHEGEQGFWQRGERLGDDAVATVSGTNEGSDRLRLMGLRADDGSMLVLSDALLGGSSLGRSAHEPRFYDTQLDVGCRPIWTPDAGVRCVPSTTLVDPYTYLMFADPACTEPAYLCTAPSDCPYSDLVLMGYDENGEYRARSRRAAVRLSGEPVFSLTGGTCTRNEPSDTPIYLRAGPALPWDEYPELVERNGRGSGRP